MATAFVDMDGVLTNFLGPALDLHGRSIPEVYGTSVALGTWEVWKLFGATAEAFWRPIEAVGFDFWANLPWTTEGRHILQMAEQVFGEPNVRLLSSPSSDPMSAAGKVAWVRRELPQYAGRLILCPGGPKSDDPAVIRGKGAVAGPGKVLIDDSDHNLAEWARGGGDAGILVPRPWNSQHRDAGRVIGAVIERIEKATGVRFINFSPEVR